MKNLFLIFSFLLFLACRQQQPTQTSAAEVESIEAEQKIDTATKDFTGLYRQGDDLTTFQDCNVNEVYWIEDPSGKLRELYGEATSHLGYQGESVHLEVVGHLANSGSSGPQADYQKKLIVSKIGAIKPKSFKTPCYNFEFIALGNEPFWSVEIIPNEQRIVLKDVGLDKVYVFPYQPANAGGGVNRYETTSGTDKLTVIIRKEKCSDGMSDREYDYSAEVQLNNRELKGCAIEDLKKL